MSSEYKRQSCLRQLLAALLFGLLLLVGPARAMDLDTYDPDSLAYQSTEIVEADLGDTGKAEGYPVTMATVTAVYKGHFKPGQQIALAALDFFRKANPDAKFGYWYDTKPLASGDHVFLFLVRATKHFLYDIPPSAEIYWPVFGGVKLVVQGQVLGFQQYNNPGPYVSNLTGPKEPTGDDFKAALAQSLENAQRFAPMLEAKTGSKNVPALMQVLRERAVRHRSLRFERDAIAEAACTRIAALQDPPLTEQAAQVVAGGEEWRILEQGFATPTGRQYLLRRIANKNLPMGRRSQLAEILLVAGSDWWVVAPAEPHFITQVAALAKDNAEAEPLCLALLSVVSDQASGISQLRQQKFAMPQIERDFQNALLILNAFYRQTRSEPVRYQIEVIEANAGVGVYAGLHSPCGQVLSLVSAVRRDSGNGKDTLGIDTSISSPFASETGAVPEIVLMRLPTRQVKTLPLKAGWSANQLEKGSGSTGTDNDIPLPSDLPHGVYRVFLLFREDGKTVSIGHYCQVSL